MISEVSFKISPEKLAYDIEVRNQAANAAGISLSEINDLRIIRKSVDARQRRIFYNVTVRLATGPDKKTTPLIKPVEFSPVSENAPVIVIVGAGPAGLFAALTAISRGLRPIVLERGKDVDSRRLDIAEMIRNKKINPGSNYCFGEGGAGTFSDGKLYTRSKKRGSVEEVLQLLVQHGASEDILIESHPHIGSDRLPDVIKSIRKTIIENGGEVRFETPAIDFVIDGGRIKGVVTSSGVIDADAVVIATGHSAHDTFRKLGERNLEIEPKGIAMGVRLEHPQELIDRIQYHNKDGRGKYLPAAEYNFVSQVEGRGVYSFCMCPGGVIVPAGSGSDELVVNGMSSSARSGRWANSGMVVEIRPGDFPEFKGAFQMLDLQESLERKMFEAAGESIVAPAQRMIDFVNGEKSESLPRTSYAPGIQSADFNEILPDFISKRLKSGFKDFGRKAKGFLTNEATLIGLESRTSSPIRMVRDKETLESVSIKGVFPAGEGAGYAGGIVSAAIDGMRCAEAAAKSLGNIKK